MNVRHRQVNTFIVDLLCDKCGNTMKPTGTTLTSNPPQHLHQCTNTECGATTLTVETFPKLDYQFVTEDAKQPEDQSEAN